MKRHSTLARAFSAAIFAGTVMITMLSSCNKSTSTSEGDLPLITPPVKAAAGAGLAGTRRLARTHTSTRALSPADFKSRFFADGPTNVLGILQGIDDRISGLNTQIAGNKGTPPTCLAQEAVAYTIAPWGQSVTMYAQCYQDLNGGSRLAADPKFLQWGKKGDVTYLYVAVGATHTAVIATPITGQAGKFKIEAWMSLGFTNAACGNGVWDGCSYGVMQITADSSAGTFEFAVAGMGFGYCGAQLKSDGTNIYGAGSTDMGTTCNAIDTLCVLASDATTAGTCGTELSTFVLPSLGRKSVLSSNFPPMNGGLFDDSEFPAAGSNVTLNGTDTDDINFGPTAPSTGVGAFN